MQIDFEFYNNISTILSVKKKRIKGISGICDMNLYAKQRDTCAK